MMNRRVVIGAVVVTVSLLVAGAASSAWLSSWVPTKGKARLEAELERQFPVDASIGTVSYAPFRGVVLTGLRVVDRASSELWVAAPIIRLRVGWLSLLLRRPVAFRAQAMVETPCPTMVVLSGRYHAGRKALSVDGRFAEIALKDITAPLSRYVPAALSDGTVRLRLHLTKGPDEPPIVSGRIEGRGLVWAQPPLRLSTDATVEGRTSPPPREGDPWEIHALLSLRNGALEGIAPLGVVSRIEGSARVVDEELAIEQLTATALGSRWRLEGTVTPLPRPHVELLLSSQAAVAPLAAAVPTLSDAWRPDGTADLRAVCRGPLRPSPTLDCLARAELRDMTLTGEKLAHPLTNISGRLDYDHVERRLAIHQLEGRVLGETLSARGTIHLSAPPAFVLNVNGRLHLEALAGWLPPEGPLSEIGGLAVLDVALERAGGLMRSVGRLELRDAHARGATFPQRVDDLTGTLVFGDNRIEVPQASLRLNDQPVTITGTVSTGVTPAFAAVMEVPRGRLHIAGRMTTEAVLIDDAQVTLSDSVFRLSGSVARQPDRPSTLKAAGTIELVELKQLPFVPLPHLEAWGLEGRASTELTFEGRWSDWRSATLRVRLQANRLGVRDIPVEQFACELEQEDRTLRVRVPAALVADGRFQGQLTVRHRTADAEFLAEADLVGLQLARLAQAVPAWRERQITGTTSAHALVTGTSKERVTWRGEGWLNASGERLADVPLLDKVFRGLFGMLGDRLGLESLRRAQMTQASVTWRLSQERMHTEDLRLAGTAGTEPVAIYARGSVGLDQTLDLVIEPELSEGIVLESPTTSTLASTILKAAGQLERLRRLIGRHRLVGTLKNPEYRFEYGTGEVLKQIAPGPTDLLQGILDTLR